MNGEWVNGDEDSWIPEENFNTMEVINKYYAKGTVNAKTSKKANAKNAKTSKKTKKTQIKFLNVSLKLNRAF